MLYFANDADTVLREIRVVQYDVAGKAITVATVPYILMSLTYEFSFTVNLNDAAIQHALKINEADLKCLWEIDILNGRTPVTQDLGLAARAAGVEALIVPSSRNPGYDNFNVIQDQLLSTSYVRIHQAEGFAPTAPTEIVGIKRSR